MEPLRQEYTLSSEDREIQAIEIILECLTRRIDTPDGLWSSRDKRMALRALRYCVLRIEEIDPEG